ncbi:hypothetical protein JXA63_04540 [Candidatus Woesebacteria bacterium]|nr:hypothetical protein [Candidatus Woesebacteria bacterium]
MNIIFRYSGFFVVFFSWIMVILPYFLSKHKKKIEALSDVGALPKIGFATNIGVMLVSISQFVFWIYISSIHPETNILRSVLILFYASFHLLLAGIVHVEIDKFLHDILIKIYFIFSLAGAYLLSDAFSVISLEISNILEFVILISGLGSIVLYYKKTIFAELWHITLSSIWIVIIYLSIL